MRRANLIAVFVALSGCDELGSGGDYWLEQRGLSSEWSKVARVFGYANNQCNDTVKAMKSKVATAPKPAEFRCVPKSPLEL
jgi:hypothetical protein